jgi:hypothetical protein
VLALLAAVVVLAVALVGALVLARGGDDEAGNDVALDDLDAALLVQADLPSGYEPGAPGAEGASDGEEEADALDVDEIDAPSTCEDGLVALGIADPVGGPGPRRTERVRAEFTGEQSTITHSLSLTPADARSLSDVRADLGECDTFTFEDETGTGTISLETSAVEGIGDAAIDVWMAVDARENGTPLSLEVYGVFVEHGGVHSDVRALSSLPDAFSGDGAAQGEAVDRARARALAATVDGRVAEVVGA